MKVHKCCIPVNKAMSEILNYCITFVQHLYSNKVTLLIPIFVENHFLSSKQMLSIRDLLLTIIIDFRKMQFIKNVVNNILLNFGDVNFCVLGANWQV